MSCSLSWRSSKSNEGKTQVSDVIKVEIIIETGKKKKMLLECKGKSSCRKAGKHTPGEVTFELGFGE